MKGARIAAAFSALTLLSAAGPANLPFAKNRIGWNKPVVPFRVIGNIYYVGINGLSAFLIVTPKGEILIDGALPESVPLVEGSIRKLGFKLSDIKILLNSHAHFDHAGGLARLKRDTGARFYASASDKPILESGHITFGPSAPVGFPPVQVDRVIKDGEMITLGGRTLTANLMPGHTPGCTTWTMPVEEGGRSHRAMFFCSMMVGGNPLVSNAAYPGIVRDFRASFAKARTLNPDVFLANHANQFDLFAKMARRKVGQPNPFIDPAEYHRFLREVEQGFKAELAKQKAGGSPTLP